MPAELHCADAPSRKQAVGWLASLPPLACRLYTGFHGSSSTAMRLQVVRLMPCVPALLMRKTCGQAG